MTLFCADGMAGAGILVGPEEYQVQSTKIQTEQTEQTSTPAHGKTTAFATSSTEYDDLCLDPKRFDLRINK